jgi:hypothetical protein
MRRIHDVLPTTYNINKVLIDNTYRLYEISRILSLHERMVPLDVRLRANLDYREVSNFTDEVPRSPAKR